MPKRKRDVVAVEYEEPEQTPSEEVKKEQTPKKRMSPIKIPPSFKPPQNWKELYDKLKHFRYNVLDKAPVDTMGCDQLSTQQGTEKDKRFHVLTSLLLSSQTKDPVTADAMARLHAFANLKSNTGAGLTVSVVRDSSYEEIDKCIEKVGFHRKKTEYLRKIADILHEKFNDDIPSELDDILELPGIGPKMAHLAMQCAWNSCTGIGVDTHVHRISNRLKWTPPGSIEKGPEFTRAVLESWLPKDLWPEVNHLLVGLGQMVCTPRNPKCSQCDAADLCPSASREVKKALKSKAKEELETSE